MQGPRKDRDVAAVARRQLFGPVDRGDDVWDSAGMKASDDIVVDPELLGGVPVFKGTRVPVKTIFEYLEDNYTLSEFLECFPSVTR
jgi:hypothetical protein